jgi:hypothetical protein
MNLAIVVTIAVAILGYFVSHLLNLSFERRKNRLMRINRQLDEFYGPLLATVKANNCAWKNFGKKYQEGEDKERGFTARHNPSKTEAKEYHNWMTNVFMPNNEALYKIVVEKTSLLEGNDGIPEPLLKLATHILEARAELKKVTSNKKALNIIYRYPADELISYCEKEFKKLKEEQSKLIKKRWYSIFKRVFAGDRRKREEEKGTGW